MMQQRRVPMGRGVVVLFAPSNFFDDESPFVSY